MLSSQRNMILDNHGREINYLRLAITDRCNLRCFYCMPQSGIQYINRSDLLSYEEMLRLVKVFAAEGISKVRITGGEPFVRKDVVPFLSKLTQVKGISEVNITTNGTKTLPYLKQLEDMGINSINLSLDSLNKERFFQITRRDVFDQVHETLFALMESTIKTKLNMVVMDGKNIEDIESFIELTKHYDVAVRFIEEMPFNGTLGQGNQELWPMKKILGHIESKFQVEKLIDQKSSTSKNFKVKEYKGSFGIIPAFTRTICGDCNRIRLTPKGSLRTCLYGEGVINFRDMMRNGSTDKEIVSALKVALIHRAKNGFEAEKRRDNNIPISESMATIGG